MDDKRRFPRLDISVGVTWVKRTSRPGSRDADVDATRNISVGGLCLVVDEMFSLGEELELTLHLPSGRAVRGTGKVAWVREKKQVGTTRRSFEIGVNFGEFSPSDWEEVRRFVSDIATLEKGEKEETS